MSKSAAVSLIRASNSAITELQPSLPPQPTLPIQESALSLISTTNSALLELQPNSLLLTMLPLQSLPYNIKSLSVVEVDEQGSDDSNTDETNNEDLDLENHPLPMLVQSREFGPSFKLLNTSHSTGFLYISMPSQYSSTIFAPWTACLKTQAWLMCCTASTRQLNLFTTYNLTPKNGLQRMVCSLHWWKNKIDQPLVKIMACNKLCCTMPSDPHFCQNGLQGRGVCYLSGFFFSLYCPSIMQEMLFEMAYASCTWKLLVHSYQQLDNINYPWILLFSGFSDTSTVSWWTTHNGNLLWDNQFGFWIFHLDIIKTDGSLVVSRVSFTLEYCNIWHSWL